MPWGHEKIQATCIELTTTVSLTKSLDQFVTECREEFDSYDVKAYDRSGNKSYKFESESHRAPKRKKHFSEGNAADALQEMPGVNKFKVSSNTSKVEHGSSAAGLAGARPGLRDWILLNYTRIENAHKVAYASKLSIFCYV